MSTATRDPLDIYDLDQPADYDDTTVGDLRESIETNLWLAAAYAAQGAAGLCRECLTAALKEYRRFEDIIVLYVGKSLGEKVMAAVYEHAPELAGGAQ